MVAALNIVASLVLLVMEKSRDIAILRTMGASARADPPHLRAAGPDDRPHRHARPAPCWALSSVSSPIAIKLIKLPADVYQITYLPFRVQPLDVVIVVVSAVLVCLAATVYPARQAGRLDPAEALRNQ